MSDLPITYTETEILSYLPSGWTIVGDPGGVWDDDKKSWTVVVEDGADLRWDLTVRQKAVDADRMGALRDAFDRLHRERLGQGTRGLGFKFKFGSSGP